MSVNSRRMFIIIWLLSGLGAISGCYYKRVFPSLDHKRQTTAIYVRNKIVNSEDCALHSDIVGGLSFSLDKILGLCKVFCQMFSAYSNENSFDVYYYNRQSCDINRCPCGWIRLESHCFFISKETKSWQEARAECARFGGHLASVLNKQINGVVISLLKPSGNGVEFWLGGNSLMAYGTWLWEFENQHLSFKKWRRTHPGKGKGDCMKIMSARQSKWKWYADFCELEKRFLCQSTPTRYTKDEF